MNALFQLGDSLSKRDYLELCFSNRQEIKGNVRAKKTGEFRPPKKGEWYLSGAIPEAYRAPNALTTAYQIARLVRTRTRTIIEEVK